MNNITNELVKDYLSRYYTPVNRKLGTLRKNGEENMIPIILKDTESFLDIILPLKKPRRILEIGTAIGYSSIYFACKCPDCKIFTIEKDKKMYEEAKKNVLDFELNDRIKIICGDGQEETEKLIRNSEEGFDLVFIDAAKSHYRRFFNAAVKASSNNVLIISDNVLQRAMTVSDIYDVHDKHRTNIRKMREYVDYICTDSKFQSHVFSIGDGIALTTFNENNEKT